LLAYVIEDASNEMTGLARLVVQLAFEHWRELGDVLIEGKSYRGQAHAEA